MKFKNAMHDAPIHRAFPLEFERDRSPGYEVRCCIARAGSTAIVQLKKNANEDAVGSCTFTLNQTRFFQQDESCISIYLFLHIIK